MSLGVLLGSGRDRMMGCDHNVTIQLDLSVTKREDSLGHKVRLA